MSAATLLKRELALGIKESGGTLSALGFFCAALTLFTFALGVEVQMQALPALLAALIGFSTLLAISQFFDRDVSDGTLEQLCLMPMACEVVVFVKWLAQMLGLQLPLLISAWAVSALQGQALTGAALLNLLGMASTCSAIGLLCAAISLLAAKPALVRMLIALPLMMPVLIFATLNGAGLWLLAMTLVAVPVAIWAGAQAMRPA